MWETIEVNLIMEIVIRAMRREEYPLLRTFLYQAIFLPPETILDTPEMQVYLTGFGESPHDRALVAEAGGQVVGVVWVRIMEDYGHVDDDTPSFSLALLPEWRGKGIGTALMREMLARLGACGYAQASLSVQKQNRAARLYRRLGFSVLRETEEEYIMVCPLTNRKGPPQQRG